jgi:hypothetical protein
MQIAHVHAFGGGFGVRATQFYEGKLGLGLQFSSPEHGYASFAGGGVRFGIAVPGPDQKGLIRRHTTVRVAVSDPDGNIVHLKQVSAAPWLAADPKRRN